MFFLGSDVLHTLNLGQAIHNKDSRITLTVTQIKNTAVHAMLVISLYVYTNYNLTSPIFLHSTPRSYSLQRQRTLLSPLLKSLDHITSLEVFPILKAHSTLSTSPHLLNILLDILKTSHDTYLSIVSKCCFSTANKRERKKNSPS
jgi:hypothetical protein